MAPNRNYRSNALPATLSSSMTSGQTTMVITASPSSLNWPASYPFSVLLDWGGSSAEVVQVNSAATGTGPYTFSGITRGVDGTTGVAHTAPQSVYHGTSGQDAGEPQYHAQATGPTTYPPTGTAVPVHGIGSGSAVVGTTDTQTLTNKSLTSPTLTTPTFSGLTSGLIDTSAGDILAPVLSSASAAAGSAGKPADASHVHPMTTDTWHTLSNPANITGAFRVMLIPPLNALWVDFQMTLSNSGGTSYTFGSMPSSGYYPPSTRNMPVALTGTPTGVASNLPRLFVPSVSGGPQLLVPTMAASGAAVAGSVLIPLS